MTAKTIIIALVIVFAALAGTRLLAHFIEPPACHSDAATRGLAAALHDPSLGTIAVNDARTVSGGFLSAERSCVADIAPVRGGVDAGDMKWRQVLYQVRKTADPDKPDVTAQMGAAVPLAPERSFVVRWVEYFLD